MRSEAYVVGYRLMYKDAAAGEAEMVYHKGTTTGGSSNLYEI